MSKTNGIPYREPSIHYFFRESKRCTFSEEQLSVAPNLREIRDTKFPTGGSDDSIQSFLRLVLKYWVDVQGTISTSLVELPGRGEMIKFNFNPQRDKTNLLLLLALRRNTGLRAAYPQEWCRDDSYNLYIPSVTHSGLKKRIFK